MTAVKPKVPAGNEIASALWQSFNSLKAKTLEPKVAKEMNNAAGKIITLHALTLKHEIEGKRKPNMPFFRSLASS